jgi:hypothetical protein
LEETTSEQFEEVHMMASGYNYVVDKVINGVPFRRIPPSTKTRREWVDLNDFTINPAPFPNQPSGWFAVDVFEHQSPAADQPVSLQPDGKLCLEWKNGQETSLPVKVPSPAAQWSPRLLIVLHQHCSRLLNRETVVAYKLVSVLAEQTCLHVPQQLQSINSAYFVEYLLAFPAGEAGYLMEPLVLSPTFRLAGRTQFSCPLVDGVNVPQSLPSIQQIFPAVDSSTFGQFKTNLRPFSKFNLADSRLVFSIDFQMKQNRVTRSMLHNRFLKVVLMRHLSDDQSRWKSAAQAFVNLKEFAVSDDPNYDKTAQIELPFARYGEEAHPGLYSVKVLHSYWIRGPGTAVQEKLLFEIGPILIK